MSPRKVAADPALIVMSRPPVPGEVKTRMQPHISAHRSAELHKALLLDTLDMAKSVRGATVFLALAPTVGYALPFDAGISEDHTMCQRGEDLGARLTDCLRKVSGMGFSPVLFIGTDSPLIRPEMIEEAIDVLTRVDVCILPANDGGYCLIGMNSPRKGLFTGIEWSTDKVFLITLQRAQEENLKTHVFQAESDLDTFKDLKDIAGKLKIAKAKDGGHFAQRTYEWMLDEHLL